MRYNKGMSEKNWCYYCGNNQISHTHAKIGALSAHYIFPPLDRLFRRMPGGLLLMSFAEGILDGLFDILVLLRIVRYKEGLGRIGNDRGYVLGEEAERRGMKVEVATVLGRSMDMYRYTKTDGSKMVFSGLPRPYGREVPLIDLDDKSGIKQLLEEAGISVSRGASFTDLGEACRHKETCDYPVIVKPRFGSRGRHTTTHITRMEDFIHAFQVTKQIAHHVMVEEHLYGSVYRGTMVGGVLAGVLAGDPPRVTGDGVHSISELIELKNAHKHERVGLFKVTPLTEPFLGRFGYTLSSILEKGKTIDLIEKIGLSYGGNAREVTNVTHPRYKEILEHAAHVVDDPLIGFDFITPDIERDPGALMREGMRWGVIECNGVPFINLHHDPLEGEPVNVAACVLESLGG